MNAMYGIGQKAEQKAARILAAKGRIVVPISLYQNNTGIRIAAPMLVQSEGFTISPDLLVIDNPPYWVEVKSKATPSYFFKKDRWEHGIDFPKAREYLKVQEKSGYLVYILVYEAHSPKTPAHMGLSHPNCDLQESGIWLCISLNLANRIGDIRPNNPNMINDDNPKGLGLYWPRSVIKLCFC